MTLLLLLACRAEGPAGVPDRELPPAPDTGAFVGGEAAPAVVLNEIQPENDSTWQAADGSLPAWAELRNLSDAAVAREDLRINGAPVAWVDDGDALAPGALALCTLPDDGAVELTWRGQRLDAVDPGDPGPDAAWARFGPDGASAWLLTGAPTPGYTNGNAPPEGTPDDLFFEDYARIDLDIPDDSRAALDADPYTGQPATLSYERVQLPVEVHLKGVYGSLRTLAGKASFSVDLNAARPGGSLRGLTKLKLNNMVQDPTGVHEHLTYALMRAAGVAAPRVGYVQVYVNGEYQGVYSNVEAEDAHFLDHNFGEHGGNLYEGAYGVDFYVGEEFAFECDSCAFPDDRSDLTAVAEVLDGEPTNAGIAALERLVDLDEFLTELAVEQVSLHWDGYTSSNNYRVFHDPGQDRFVLIPWGVDQTWIDEYYSPWSGLGRVLQFCIANADCEVRYERALLDAADLAESLDLPTMLQGLLVTYNADFLADPRKEWDEAEHAQYLTTTRANLEGGPDRVRAEVAAR